MGRFGRSNPLEQFVPKWNIHDWKKVKRCPAKKHTETFPKSPFFFFLFVPSRLNVFHLAIGQHLFSVWPQTKQVDWLTGGPGPACPHLNRLTRRERPSAVVGDKLGSLQNRSRWPVFGSHTSFVLSSLLAHMLSISIDPRRDGASCS